MKQCTGTCASVMAERRSSGHAEVDQNDGGTLKQRRIKKIESYLAAGNVFGGIWRSFSGAAYWMVCNS